MLGVVTIVILGKELQVLNSQAYEKVRFIERDVIGYLIKFANSIGLRIRRLLNTAQR